uniref:Zinc knuckle CX2CX4HX4C n=1 Tax=Tanacetum cinerariifolium TaxID=118510 RepID=A0A6L2KC78_TANCI|nr:zinc knuckle CX2CX4HX4C [Tanacetum cinerariifolium]
MASSCEAMKVSQAAEVIAALNGMPAVTSSTVNVGTPNEIGHESLMKDIPASSANKLSPTSLTKANLRKLDTNVPNGADYDVWLPLASVHEAISNFNGPGYTKETIHVEYEWKPPRCVFCHLVNDCLKALKRAINRVDIGNGGSYGVDDDGFIEVKRNKSRGNNGGTKNFKSVLVKHKTVYHPKVNQSTGEVSPKTAPSADDHDSEDEVEPIDNEMLVILPSSRRGVGYGQEILDNIQSICNNLDIKVRDFDACPNAMEMWKAIERLKQGESINIQNLETNMYWEFRKFTSQEGESLNQSPYGNSGPQSSTGGCRRGGGEKMRVLILELILTLHVNSGP